MSSGVIIFILLDVLWDSACIIYIIFFLISEKGLFLMVY